MYLTMINKFAILILVHGIAVFFYPIKAVSKVEFPKPLFREQPESGFFIGEDMKLCECGCGQPTTYCGEGKYKRFIQGHYSRWYRKNIKCNDIRICNIKGCDKKHYAKGLCIKCYREQYHQDNKTKIAKWGRKWRQTSIGKVSKKAYYHNRRTLTKDLTPAIIQQVYEDNIKKYGVLTCYLCFEPIIFGDERLKDSIDHSTPVTRQGSNEYENLGIAHLVCNIRKHTMTLGEWFKYIRIGKNRHSKQKEIKLMGNYEPTSTSSCHRR